MSAVPAKKMLEKLLTAGTLPAKDREAFESMWDAVHKYGKLTGRQLAWVESSYFALEKSKGPPVKSPKVGFVTSTAGLPLRRAFNFKHFLELCPKASPELQKTVKRFFGSGGEIFEIRPKDRP